MIVDLSQLVNGNTPVYPGDPEVNIKPAGMIKKDGYNDHLLSIGTHVGTHVDAPFHMIEGGKTLDQFPVEQFVGRGVLIELENKTYDLKKLVQADIKAEDIVLFRSGLSSQYTDPDYFEDYPAMPVEVAEFLASKKVKMVGLDMCSPDHDEFVAHKILLASEVLIIENLTNLGKLVGHDFKVYALPLNLQIDGSPARVIAEISD